jgi:hypothetical protein
VLGHELGGSQAARTEEGQCDGSHGADEARAAEEVGDRDVDSLRYISIIMSNKSRSGRLLPQSALRLESGKVDGEYEQRMQHIEVASAAHSCERAEQSGDLYVREQDGRGRHPPAEEGIAADEVDIGSDG